MSGIEAQEAPQRRSFLDPSAVRRVFARAAPRYSEHDFLAREVDRRMQERLDYVKITPQRVLDLGASRGASCAALRARYPQAHLIAADFSEPMLAQSHEFNASWRRWLPFTKNPPAQPLVADANALPLRAGSIGLLWSNLLLHWLNDPLPVFAEAHRSLEVGGLLMFSTLGPDTFKELRMAFADGYSHTQRFIDMHDLGDMLVHSGFADPVMDMETMTLTYESFDALLAEMRSSAGACVMHTRRKGLIGRGVWERVREAYAKHLDAGRWPLTIEVVYGHAWKAQPKKTLDGRSVIHFQKN